jgi:secreted trypsin-like serine protease
VTSASAYQAGGVTAPRFVLTARHCIRYNQARNGRPAGWVAPPEDVLVFFATQPNVHEASYRVVSHAVHPRTDLAMLELAQAAPAAPLPINREDLDDYVGDRVRVAGFGVTAPGKRDAGIKRVGSAQILSATTAGVVQTATRSLLDTNHDVAMVGPGKSGQSICAGDSGGPEFLNINGVEYVAGVTSFSYGPPVAGQDIPDCTHPETLAGVVRVDKNIDWMQSFVRERGAAPSTVFLTASISGCQTASGAVTLWSVGLGLFFLVALRRRVF